RTAPGLSVFSIGSFSYLNLKNATCSLPSFNLTISLRQVPSHDFSVFQLKLYFLSEPWLRPPPARSTGSAGPTGAPPLQEVCCDAGEPGAKMSTPLFPSSENLTGMARPALTTLTAGALSIGGKNPSKL